MNNLLNLRKLAANINQKKIYKEINFIESKYFLKLLQANITNLGVKKDPDIKKYETKKY